MRRPILSLFTVLIGLHAFSQDTAPVLNLVPWPVEVKQPRAGTYALKTASMIYCDFPGQDSSVLIPYLQNELKKWNIALTLTPDESKADIRLLMRRMPTGGKPAYKLQVDDDGVRIESNFSAPGFHGIQTLLQLLPVMPGTREPVSLPYVEIFDHARFDYRGMHLDVCRHFFPVSFIKKYIDYLAYHKLNTFHWHLTEDQGWRVEIKKYPKLTSIGAWRNGTIIGRYPGTGNDNVPYGGFFTQDEIREVVQYAKDRFIDVIPEIEMPGHSSAAIASYPFLSCFPEKPTKIPANMISKKSIEEQKNGRVKLVQETWGIFEDVFCAGNDSTFAFLQNVIDEVVPLFPSKYFHIGGDECPKTHWKKCPKCQKRIKELGLKDEHELQSYFVQRIEKYLNKKGKTLIGWDEILEGGLAPNAVVMSWRGEKGGIEAAKQNHFVVMTPGNPLYFDHTQSENEDSVTFGGYNPIEKVYAYDPVPKELNEAQGKYILGAQANVWAEYIRNTKKVEYTIFPRMAALSEILWSPKENRNWKHFESRLLSQMKRYESWGANYSKAYYDLKSAIFPGTKSQVLSWDIQSTYPAAGWFDLSIKEGAHSRRIATQSSRSGTFEISSPGLYRVEFRILNGKDTVTISSLEQKFHFNKATGKKMILTEEPSPTYPGTGPNTLVNGVISEKGFSRTKEFLGWSGKDCIAIIDLGQITEIEKVTVHSLQRRTSWIWEPTGAEVLVSGDQNNWKPVATSSKLTDAAIGNGKQMIQISFPKITTRFVKVIVKNRGKIPAGNAGEGRDAWLFIDEIEID